jgi:hypothetical protein
MKRIKTWKHEKVQLCNFPEKGQVIWCRYVPESDYRKMKAVFDAAMKWYDVHDGLKPNISSTSFNLDKACERARK